jgi:Leucine-rich repeat (LRR) protein
LRFLLIFLQLSIITVTGLFASDTTHPLTSHSEYILEMRRTAAVDPLDRSAKQDRQDYLQLITLELDLKQNAQHLQHFADRQTTRVTTAKPLTKKLEQQESYQKRKFEAEKRVLEEFLTRLDLSLNSLYLQKRGIPNHLERLTCLWKLELCDNRLLTIPDVVGTLPSLSQLILSRNFLGTVPRFIGDMKSLTLLVLDHNFLRTLPPETGSLTNLMELNITGNFLTQLPDTFGELCQLGRCSASENRLESLPESFTSLQNLRRLYLDDNRFATYPPQLESLKALDTLSMRRNQLGEIKHAVGALRRLTSLDLSHNEINNIEAGFGRCIELIRLNLAWNRIRIIPVSMGNLTKLEVLDLQSNAITLLPSTLCGLLNLRELYLTKNSIRSLPSGLVRLPKLKWIWLRHNDLNGMPIHTEELVDFSTLQISTYPEIISHHWVRKIIGTLNGNSIFLSKLTPPEPIQKQTVKDGHDMTLEEAFNRHIELNRSKDEANQWKESIPNDAWIRKKRQVPPTGIVRSFFNQ